MRYRKPKRSYVLPVVTTLAVAAPLATLALGDSPDYRTAGDTRDVPAQLAQVLLDNAPDIVLPLHDLTGLDLPDLRLSDLRMLPIPQSIPIPDGLPLPPGVQLPKEIPLPDLNSGQTSDPGPASNRPPAPGNSRVQTIPQRAPAAARFIAEPGIAPDTPALAPGAVPPELLDQVGAQVKEISRETPFSVVALTARDLENTGALIRARQPDGGWGRWYDAEPIDTYRNDHSGKGATDGTEPIYVGNTTAVQVLVTRKQAAPHTATPVAAQEAPAQQSDSLTAVLIDPGHSADDDSLATVAAVLPAGGPHVITRAQWGADESLRCEEPTYDDDLGGVTVHHTAGRNDYSRAESAAIVRAIYTYHAKTLGWCDIGYNALVDKYGQIFEGRYGGLDRPVQGAHAGGFNENTSGVALMGDHESEEPTPEAIEAIGEFVGWRTKIAGLNPKGYTTMYSEGTSFTPYAKGEAVQLPIVFAHRDVGNTTCPGDAAYALMDRIRDIAADAPVSPGVDTRAGRHSEVDLSALTALTTKLLNMVQDNVIAKHWSMSGGPTGRLGAVKSELLPAAQGQQYAEFTNGYVYTAPDGQVVEVAGDILTRFLEFGGDKGMLGLPVKSAYRVPEGLRADFQNGSLIRDETNGVVRPIWKTYNDTYQQQASRISNAAGPVPEATGTPVAEPRVDVAPAGPAPEGTGPAPHAGTTPAAPEEAGIPDSAPDNAVPEGAGHPEAAPAGEENASAPAGTGPPTGVAEGERGPADELDPYATHAPASQRPIPPGTPAPEGTPGPGR